MIPPIFRLTVCNAWPVTSASDASRLEELEQLTVIPRGDRKQGTVFWLQDDAAPAIRRFFKVHTRDRRRVVRNPKNSDCDAVIPVLLALVPRPDNDYDPQAVAVTAPPDHGGDVLQRHLGYLYRSARLSAPITELTAHSPVPVGCHGYIELYELHGDGEDTWEPSADRPLTQEEEKALGFAVLGLRLWLPWAKELAPIVADYGAKTPKVATVHASNAYIEPRQEAELRTAHLSRLGGVLRSAVAARAATGDWARETTRSRIQAAREQVAGKQTRAWETWRQQPHGYRGITAITRSTFGNDRVLLLDDNGAEIGQWHLPHGPLTLIDERVRGDALAALTDHGITNAGARDLGALADFPDATIMVRGSTWSVHTIPPGSLPGRLPEIARYDSDSRVLTVYARAHQEAVQTLLRRHGVTVGSMRWGAPDRDVEDRNMHAATPWARTNPLMRGTFLQLRKRTQGHIPDEHADLVGIHWGKGGAPRHPTTGEELRLYTHEQLTGDLYTGYRKRLGALLGTASDDLRPTQCRLCYEVALGAAGGLAYCPSCVTRATGGLLRDTGTDGPWTAAALWALRQLADIEFFGPPSQAQLNRLTVTDPDTADAAMLARFLVPRPAAAAIPARHTRPARTWAGWLGMAGLLGEGLRTARGTLTVATDGHPCRSLLERHIDDYLHRWAIPHDIEPAYPRHPRLNTTGLRADWRLEDGTYVEALGLPDEPAYAKKVARKRELAAATGTPLVTVTADDLNRLPDVFAAWLLTASPR